MVLRFIRHTGDKGANFCYIIDVQKRLSLVDENLLQVNFTATKADDKG